MKEGAKYPIFAQPIQPQRTLNLSADGISKITSQFVKFSPPPGTPVSSSDISAANPLEARTLGDVQPISRAEALTRLTQGNLGLSLEDARILVNRPGTVIYAARTKTEFTGGNVFAIYNRNSQVALYVNHTNFTE
jgi:hypothetical protein